MSGRVSRNPVGLLFSRTLWASVGYLLGYLVIAWVLYAVAVALLVGGGLLSLTLVGLPVLLAAAAVIRGCANFERVRLGAMGGGSVSRGYRDVTGSGFLARLRTRWTDPALWRDVAYLFGLMAPLWILDFGVTMIWLVLLAGITVPAWYWAPQQTFTIGVSGSGTSTAHGVQLGYFPHGPHGHPHWGVYVDTLPKALAVAGVCLILWLLFDYVLVWTAQLHAAIARGLLSAPGDPLRQAKEVLERPGPLYSRG
jgi:Putative sensor